jgi:hypothetical protein
LAGETEVLRANLPQCGYVHHKFDKFHLLCPGTNSGRRCGRPATNRLSYGTAYIIDKSKHLQLIFINRVFRNKYVKYIPNVKLADSKKRVAMHVGFANLFIDNCMKVKANAKVKVSLCLINQPRHDDVWGMEVSLHNS